MKWKRIYLSETAWQITENNNLISRGNSVCCYCEILYRKRLSRVQRKGTRWNLEHIAHAKNNDHLHTTSAGSTSQMIAIVQTISMFCVQYHICGVNIQANPVIKLVVIPMWSPSRLGDSGCFFLRHPFILEVGKNMFVGHICHFIVKVMFASLHLTSQIFIIWINFQKSPTWNKIIPTKGWDLHFVVRPTSRGNRMEPSSLLPLSSKLPPHVCDVLQWRCPPGKHKWWKRWSADTSKSHIAVVPKQAWPSLCMYIIYYTYPIPLTRSGCDLDFVVWILWNQHVPLHKITNLKDHWPNCSLKASSKSRRQHNFFVTSASWWTWQISRDENLNLPVRYRQHPPT